MTEEKPKHPSLELLQPETQRSKLHLSLNNHPLRAVDEVLSRLQPFIENKQHYEKELSEINGLIEKLKPVLEARGALIGLDESFDNFTASLKQIEARLNDLITLKKANAELEQKVLTKLLGAI